MLPIIDKFSILINGTAEVMLTVSFCSVRRSGLVVEEEHAPVDQVQLATDLAKVSSAKSEHWRLEHCQHQDCYSMCLVLIVAQKAGGLKMTFRLQSKSEAWKFTI